METTNKSGDHLPELSYAEKYMLKCAHLHGGLHQHNPVQENLITRGFLIKVSIVEGDLFLITASGLNALMKSYEVTTISALDAILTEQWVNPITA